jgi:hypothetical protein
MIQKQTVRIFIALSICACLAKFDNVYNYGDKVRADIKLEIDGVRIGETESELIQTGWYLANAFGRVKYYEKGIRGRIIKGECDVRDGQVELVTGHQIRTKDGILALPGEPPNERLRQQLGWQELPATPEALTPRWGKTTENWKTPSGERVSSCQNGEEYTLVSAEWRPDYNK